MTPVSVYIEGNSASYQLWRKCTFDGKDRDWLAKRLNAMVEGKFREEDESSVMLYAVWSSENSPK